MVVRGSGGGEQQDVRIDPADVQKVAQVGASQTWAEVYFPILLLLLLINFDRCSEAISQQQGEGVGIHGRRYGGREAWPDHMI